MNKNINSRKKKGRKVVKVAWIEKKRIFIYKHIFMRYKNNVLDKLTQTDTIVNRINLEVNRNVGQDRILESIEALKTSIESLREIIAIEPDDFENQFSPR